MELNEAQKKAKEFRANNLKSQQNLKEKPKTKLKLITDSVTGVVILALVLAFFGFGFYGAFFYKNPHNQKPEKDQNTIWIEEQFSTWNGEHNKLASIAKSHLKFPDTYEHVETTYFRNNTKNEITVKTTFLGQNAFGVKQKSCIMAIYSFTGTEKTSPSSC